MEDKQKNNFEIIQSRNIRKAIETLSPFLAEYYDVNFRAIAAIAAPSVFLELKKYLELNADEITIDNAIGKYDLYMWLDYFNDQELKDLLKNNIRANEMAEKVDTLKSQAN